MQIRPKLEEGWSTLVLVWAMILISAMAVMEADLIDGLHVVPLVGTFAVLVGVLLAKSNFPAKRAHFFSLVYGVFVVTYLIGATLPPDMPWNERVFDLGGRLAAWLEKAFSGGTSRDGLIFVIHTSAIYWLLGYTAAWFTFRKPLVWLAVVPTGLVLLSVVYYYNGPKLRLLSLYMIIYLLVTFMYVARTYLATQEKTWRSAAVRYEQGIWFNFVRAGFLASLVALLVAWSIPTLSASAAVSDALGGTRGPWREFQDNWTRLFSALRAYGTPTSDPYQGRLVLGGPRTVGNSLIMDIYVPEEMPYVYWQAIVHDTYADGAWSTKEENSFLHYPDDGVLNVPFALSREVITQTVINYLPNASMLYAAPEFVGSNRQMYVDGRTDSNGNNLVSTVRSRFVLRQGDQYQVVSRISTIDASSLRAASTSYPAWVTDTYLQLPATITPETVALAEDLTAPYNNPFDKAIAVRDYLRQHITYNDQIDAVPDGFEPVHYTLFVSREGYCTYYASAMAVMLRSQGVPARLVSGYAQGEYDEPSRSYRVRANNAHTWVEVYFPTYGWIQFEPTASLPAADRPELPAGSGAGGDAFASPSIFPEMDDSIDLLADIESRGGLPPEFLFSPDEAVIASFSSFWGRIPTWQALGAVIVLLVAFGVILLANEFNKRVESDVERSYTRLGSWARWLGVLFRPTQTPYERADLMVTAVPEGKAPIRNLTQQYVLKQFSRDRASANGFDSLQEWRALRPVLLRQAAVKQLQRWQKRNGNR